MKKIQIILFLVLLSAVSRAQDENKKQFLLAENLYSAGNYFDAITEYKRLLFFDSSKTFQYDANLKIGFCYKAGAKFDDAIKYFEIAGNAAAADSQKFRAEIEAVRVNILRRTTPRALQILDSLDSNYRFASKKDEINYWRGWAYMFADEWQKAAQSFEKIDAGHPLKTLCQNTLKSKYSVTFAKVISYILPGSGQIYTGNYLSGLMSLGWNVMFGYLTVNSFAEDRVFDGIVIGELLWFRFYRGNIQNAGEFAEKKNLEIINKSYLYLQNNYEGMKP